MRVRGSFLLGAQLPTGGPHVLCSPAGGGLPGPVPSWLGSESVRPWNPPQETCYPQIQATSFRISFPRGQDACALHLKVSHLSLTCAKSGGKPQQLRPRSDSLLLSPAPTPRLVNVEVFLRSALFLHEWGLRPHHLDLYQFLFLVTKHLGQEVLPLINIMIVIRVARALLLE